jgi:hypothetical protein
MKYKLATALWVVVALVVSTVSVLSDSRPAQAQTASWNLDDYGPRSSDNVVLKWNEQLLETIRKNPPATGPTVTARALGVVHTAMYDAWAAYDPVAKGTRLGGSLRRPAAEHILANKSKAISFAAYKTLLFMFPDETYHRKAAYDAQMAALNYAIDGSDTSPAAMVGIAAAQAVIDYRSSDGSNQLGSPAYSDTTNYTSPNDWNNVADYWRWQRLCTLTLKGIENKMPPTPTDGSCAGPNYARQNPLTPQWGKVTPFALGLPNQYQLSGPPKNADGSYSTVDIQKAIDFAANLDDAKKAKAEYWADGPFSVFPPGHDFVFAQALSRRRSHSIDTDAKLFFMLGNAMMDASIAAWFQKFKYDYVRPITAIRNHPDFKNKMVNSWLGPNKGFDMVKGSEWMPYQALNVVTPPFPEYVSGHSTFSGAGAYILSTFSSSGDTFGASVVIPRGTSKFELNTPTADVTLSWPTFTAASYEAGDSRRWGGIHFFTGDNHGRSLGRQVGSKVRAKAQTYFAGSSSG